jgi:hypothetical protein
LNGLHIQLIYNGDVNLLAKSMNTIRRNTDALLPTTNEVGLEVFSRQKKKYRFLLVCSCLVIRMQVAIMRM